MGLQLRRKLIETLCPRPRHGKAFIALLDELDQEDVELLRERAAKARAIVYQATDTEWLRQQIIMGYTELENQYGPGVAVAVRSSATAEDLPTASFAGQHESFLNVRGGDDLFEACRQCFASIFTDRAISYRVNNGFDHFKVFLSVGVMKMVNSGPAASGVMFTLDTESGFRDVVFITATYGLGENIVQGERSIPTNSTCTNRRSGRDIGRCCLASSGVSNCEWSTKEAISARQRAM
jgi:pyruvate,water dikinase